MKDQLTPAELAGFNMLVEKGRRAQAVEMLLNDPTGRILNTDKLYLAQQELLDANAALGNFLKLCGVENPEGVQVMENGQIVTPGKSPEERAKKAREGATAPQPPAPVEDPASVTIPGITLPPQ